jgi:putative ABC transport system ATP-binding protein
MINLFRRLNQDGTTIVVVTHDAQMAQAAGRRILMRDGVIVSTDDSVSGVNGVTA